MATNTATMMPTHHLDTGSSIRGISSPPLRPVDAVGGPPAAPRPPRDVAGVTGAGCATDPGSRATPSAAVPPFSDERRSDTGSGGPDAPVSAADPSSRATSSDAGCPSPAVPPRDIGSSLVTRSPPQQRDLGRPAHETGRADDRSQPALCHVLDRPPHRPQRSGEGVEHSVGGGPTRPERVHPFDGAGQPVPRRRGVTLHGRRRDPKPLPGSGCSPAHPTCEQHEKDGRARHEDGADRDEGREEGAGTGAHRSRSIS